MEKTQLLTGIGKKLVTATVSKKRAGVMEQARCLSVVCIGGVCRALVTATEMRYLRDF